MEKATSKENVKAELKTLVSPVFAPIFAEKPRSTSGGAFCPVKSSLIRPDFVFIEDSVNWFKLYNSATDSSPIVLTSAISISAPRRTDFKLSHGALRCLTTPNAGGTSEWSEAISFEILRFAYGATLLRTEMEIEYRGASKITDFAVMINGAHLGVSVTRAMSFGRDIFDFEEAVRLLTKKLEGVVASTRGVIKSHRWKRQILHVLCEDYHNQDLLLDAYETLDASLKADTMVLITTTRGNSKFIYSSERM